MAVSPILTDTDISGREIKLHGSLDFPAACYANAFPPNMIPPHWHEELECINVIRGKLRLTAASGSFEMEEGTGVFINSNVLHTVHAEAGEAEIRSIVFSASLLGGQENSIIWTKYILPLTGNGALPFFLFSDQNRKQKRLMDLVEQVWNMIAEETHGYEITVRNLLSDFLLEFTDQIAEANLPSCQPDHLRREQRLKCMLEYIRMHYSDALTVSEIAESASISKSECLRCFREGIGIPPMQYAGQLRLRMAAKYLRTTDWPITEIGEKCGFQEMGYFAARFRQQYGMTPGEYRRNQNS